MEMCVHILLCKFIQILRKFEHIIKKIKTQIYIFDN